MTDRPEPRSGPGLTPGHDDGRLVAPAASRNEVPIIDALAPLLGTRRGLMLELGSGTGQHIAAWAGAFPGLDWQPSDPFEQHHDSIRAWVAHAACPNLRAPIWLDAAEDWPKLEPLAGVISVNVIHITPWVVTEGIFRGAKQGLAPGGLLIFYGPFKENGVHTGDGNAAFDAKLRADDPAWGIRDLDDVSAVAADSGFTGPDVMPMPANNRLVIYRKQSAGRPEAIPPRQHVTRG
ncbi:MAG: DUF938 domain-containing protein [Pseudomonadota bacterium]